MRILDYALALDGGTQVVVLEDSNGERLAIGLDGRMHSPGEGKQLFMGSAPDSPDVKMLPIGGSEEARLIALLEEWADQTQGYLRREALMEADQASLEGQDFLDRQGLEFLLEVRNRDVD